MLDRQQVLRQTRAQLHPERIARREAALARARMLIEGSLGQLDETGLRRLLQLFNADHVDGRDVNNRFATGLVGNNANLLVAALAGVNVAVPSLWQADHAWLVQHLTALRRGGSLPGGGWLFPSMILHTRDPRRFPPVTTTMARGLAAIDGGTPIALGKPTGYLDYSVRVRMLLEEHTISPHGVDVLLWQGAQLAGEAADSDAGELEEPPAAPPAAAPPAAATPAPEPARPASGRDATTVGVVVPGLDASAKLSRSTRPPERDPSASRPAPSTPARPASLGWLHLTDLHQGMGGTSWLWPNVMGALFDDLARLHDLCGPWDLVLFTGDLTQRGSPDEFKKLDATLDRLWRRFDQLGSQPRLITVPGNHDLERPRSDLDPYVLALSQWHERPRLRDHVLDEKSGRAYLDFLAQVFKNYTEWVDSCRWHVRDRWKAGVLPGDSSYSLSLHGLELGVIGLNSAFLQLTGGDYQERLAVDPRQLHVVCDEYAPEWLQRHHINLLLTHHPPEWLHPQARQEFRQEVDPAGRFAAHFFGHMHEGTATSTAHGGGHARHALQGASLFGLEEHDGPGGRGVTRLHGFSAGRFELLPGAAQARVRVFPRRMFTSAGGRRIDRDVSAYHLDERGSFAYEVPTARRA
ncbi:metallophosphoesterase family protein [Sorangium sp. So ce388]|uniref:metallophosphoesterase family protein n=1 Tax=Sorangium sp. So ce388 TaxID=3133309 RepID=UPI003F5C7874